MHCSVTGQLVGSEIHGFHTLQELDVGNMMEEAKSRWLRPNEILAILCNYKYFTINAKPVNLPNSGTIVLFDRKMLRNFRKDGHNWKKKNDGKTVKEAHEHLKVGNEERIHVYYAHGQDNPTFVRRSYWLLDKSLEHIVLVHYRDTRELQGSPVTQVNSSSSSHSDPTAPGFTSDEFDSGAVSTPFWEEKETLEVNDNLSIGNYHQRLHEINTLEWDELLSANDPKNSVAVRGGKVDSFETQNQTVLNGPISNGNINFPVDGMSKYGSNDTCNFPESVCTETVFDQETPEVQSVDPLTTLLNDGLQSQDSLGTWINNIIVESPCCAETTLEPSETSGNDTFSSLGIEHFQPALPEQIFHVTDISPVWAPSTEKTKILITGLFHEEYFHLSKSDLFCVCGDEQIPVETVQVGVYRSVLPPHPPGFVNFYLSLDGHKPISQVLNFEYRTPVMLDPLTPVEDRNKWDDFRVQMRLAKLVFTKSKNLDLMSTNLSSTAIEKARKFALRTAYISNRWDSFMNSTVESKISLSQAKDTFFELTMKNRLKEWLLERIALDCKITEYDSQGQGVIHLCAILGYTWAITLYSWSGFSLDFRDKHGWTALHWATYLGREKMVAVLLSAGAKPNLVTDPTSRNPGGYTAADLAYMKGYDGLAAYLSEKALVEQFKDMSVAGNISGTLKTSTTYTVDSSNLTEDELFMKDTLAAYRTAAEAAGRIQSAFREHSFRLRAKVVEFSNPEDEARNIVAAMKIQHAFRNYESRKMMAAAARIQYRFRSWKLRREFLNMRRQAIKIQAAFRGFQVRKQYRKILWSVGVLEKVILRWRLKRRGFRGLQVNTAELAEDQKQESDTEEDFYRTSRKQAEDRVERSVIRVQAMFRSRKAQEEYRRMKLTHNQAKLKYDGLVDPGMEIES